MEKQEIKIGAKTGELPEECKVEIIGQISQKDMDDGTVLIFRIDDLSYPPHIMRQIADSIKTSVIDTFQGQIKAIILPKGVEVQTIRDILHDVVEKGDNIE